MSVRWKGRRHLIGPHVVRRSAEPGKSAPASVPVLPGLDDEYEIVRELGRGGTAVVYHARERGLGRDVAIKAIRPGHDGDPEAAARLAREARLVARLRHPHIVPLYATRQLADGGLALVMQYVPGRTLKDAIRSDGPMPVASVERILREIALALSHAHRRHRIVHRDIKPENIYVDAESGHALLADFGIARSDDADASLTMAGTALGTPAYMSPEQIDGLPLDGRSDLYSLGLVAWEMLTGQQPWAGYNIYTIIYRQKHEPLPALPEYRLDLPMYLLRAIEGLLHKDRADRWSDAHEFIAQLSPAAARVATPAVTVRRAAPAFTADSPTILYRRDDVESAAVETGAALAVTDAEPASDVATADAVPGRNVAPDVPSTMLFQLVEEPAGPRISALRQRLGLLTLIALMALVVFGVMAPDVFGR